MQILHIFVVVNMNNLLIKTAGFPVMWDEMTHMWRYQNAWVDVCCMTTYYIHQDMHAHGLVALLFPISDDITGVIGFQITSLTIIY